MKQQVLHACTSNNQLITITVFGDKNNGICKITMEGAELPATSDPISPYSKLLTTFQGRPYNSMSVCQSIVAYITRIL